MPSQHFSRASTSIARQVMNDAIATHLYSAGPAVARAHVEKLGGELSIIYGNEGQEAYREAMAQIAAYEEAERQKAAELQRIEFQKLMETVISTIQPQKDTQPSQANSRQSDAETGEVVLSPKLSSPKAMRIWQRLQQAGYIDEHYQPVAGLSRTDVALLAEAITIQLADENDNLLDIKEWKPYEILWHRSNMKADHQRARLQDKTSEFRKKLKDLFKDI